MSRPKVRFNDVQAQAEGLEAAILAAWEQVLRSGRFVSGEHVAAFEKDFAAACGTEISVGLSTGTDALMLALLAAGVRAGDRVAVPVNSFIATAEAVSNIGAHPVFVDCDESGTMDADRLAEVVHMAGLSAVVVVHLFGTPADMSRLAEVATEAGLTIVEDAAQAHLAEYRGRRAGGLAPIAAFSFYPGKNLGAPGEGGAVTTDDPAIADRVRMLRDHGQSAKYVSQIVGYNSRMSELVAAALRIKLPHLQSWTDRRRRCAALYDELLDDQGGVTIPPRPEGSLSSFHLYVVEVDDRQRVVDDLDRRGIETGLHYPVPIHLQPAYEAMGHKAGDFPVAERKAERQLSLPMHHALSDDDVRYVCRALLEAVR